ncbi:MAG: 50S ribosomal protein L9 [Ignavibacteriae bacterium]|nr:50S ribosomal protein L9 [Ignavibacteria bacterium]MBI3365226.1 50S ribosomal protein L9 [Ignavibacteriota bacterium]
MKVILRQDFEKLGKLGDIVVVKDGYARNYLIPRNIGYAATRGNLQTLEEEKKQHENRQKKEFHHAEKLAAELEKISVTLKVKVGEDEKLFGSVTSQMIADALKEKGINADKRNIELDEPIKALGIYTVNMKLHSNIIGKVKVWVVRE